MPQRLIGSGNNRNKADTLVKRERTKRKNNDQQNTAQKTKA